MTDKVLAVAIALANFEGEVKYADDGVIDGFCKWSDLKEGRRLEWLMYAKVAVDAYEAKEPSAYELKQHIARSRRDIIAKMNDEGHIPADIARHVGVTVNQVRVVLRKMGLKTKSRQDRDARDLLILRMVEDGASREEISAAIGASNNAHALNRIKVAQWRREVGQI